VRLRNASLLVLLVLTSLVAQLPSEARAEEASHTIGFLTPYTPETEARWHTAFEQALQERGYVQGRNVSILYRFAQGHDELLPGLVAELLRFKADVLLTVGTPATRAAQRGTKIVPIVMVTVLDPVHAGFVASLSRPGANITGSSELSEELVPKRLALLKEGMPRAARIAVLWDPSHLTNALDLKRTEDAARTLGLKVRGIAAHDRAEVDKAFVEMKRWRADALVVLTSYSAFVHLSRIVELADSQKLPTMYGTREGAEAGALMSYGPDVADQYRHAAAFVDKILKGADPANLPVEQPTRFELVINVTTAKRLGITFPQSILVRAEEFIK
jgi:putative tryptophan/tyrosine transport system substrate-binding protein